MADDIEEAMARASQQQRFGSTPPSSDGEEEAEADGGHEQKADETPSGSSSAKEPERRFVDGRWVCLYENGAFCEFVNDQWTPVPADANLAELRQKWEAAGGPPGAAAGASARQVVDGIPMVWNPMARSWLPEVNVDEDFMAHYQANYGVTTDFSAVPAPQPKKPAALEAAAEKAAPLTKQEKMARKREAAAAEAERRKGWIDMDETHNTKVYVSGLPTTITDQEFIAFMNKCGAIMDDPRNNKPKVKLYKDDEGQLKGDGICCYVHVESVQLALDILDGTRYDLEHTVHVERAKFELKGNYDPAKKKSRLTAAQKKKFLEKQQKRFEWKPEKPRNYRPVHECTVVLKNMFTLTEIDENAALIFDLKQEMKDMYGKFGDLKRVVVYDTNPEGVITLTYENVEQSDLAVKSLDGVLRHGRVISASLWDGRTKYKRAETEEERRERDEAWQRFLGVGEDDGEEDEEAEGERQEAAGDAEEVEA